MNNSKEKKMAREEAKDFVLSVFNQATVSGAGSSNDKNTILAIRQAAYEGDWDMAYETLGLIEEYLKDLKKRMK